MTTAHSAASSPRRPVIQTVDAANGFAATLAAHWLDACGHDPVRSGDGLILLPTRRGVRALTDAFLVASRRPALLVPRIEAIGSLDDDPLDPAADLDIPPAIEPLRRAGALTRLVLARDDRVTPAAAWELAVSLADLLDEAARHGVDLGRALPALAPEALAAHWQITLDVLSVVTTHWPAALAGLDLSDPAARQARLLQAQAKRWRDRPPAHPVWLAGLAAATPAETALARAVAALAQGRVIVQGLDLELDDASWDEADDAHPQAGLKRLLAGLGCTRGDVQPLAGDRVAPPGRVALLRRALLPARSVGRHWREPAGLDPSGLHVLPAADEQREAAAIALILREALEQPGRTAALVTPDRALAGRVAAALARFGILADDSAGEPLSETPAAVLLRLLATALAGDLPPATLLALLKHPFAVLGGSRDGCRVQARRLERLALRGPRPQAGMAGLRRAVEAAHGTDSDRAAALGFLDQLAHALQPLAPLSDQPRVAPAALARALAETAERVADPSELWAGEEGEALARHMADLAEALVPLPPQPPSCLPGLLEASLRGVTVYGRRALRGHDAGAVHPRLSIWGLLEARGQTADVLVLGGLTEGIWPAATDPGPWMGRPMRAAVGLPSPEIAVGVSAGDWSNLAAAAPAVVLSYPARRDHAPAVPSRWITRLEACLAGAGLRLPVHPALAWADALDQPIGAPVPAVPPRPKPPLSARPRRLSVTEIETWLRDPYSIYARHILRLRALPPLEEEADRALFGTVVHHALAEGYRDGAVDADGLERRFEAALDRFSVRPAVASWWRPRLRRIADWVAAREAERRAAGCPPDRLATEIDGRVVLDADAGAFTLTGRADRIERRGDGLLILDYKTGTVPSDKAVTAGWSPQLPLEATMALLGGFGDEFRGADVAELAHWKLSGGPKPGEAQTLSGARLAEIVADNWHGFQQRIEAFDDPDTAYLAQPNPRQAPRFDDYGILARVAEWRLAEDE